MINIEEVKKIREYLKLLELPNDKIISVLDMKKKYDILSIKYDDDNEKFLDIKHAYDYIINNINKVNNYISSGFTDTSLNIQSNSKTFVEFEKQKNYSNQEQELKKKQEDYDQKVIDLKNQKIFEINNFFINLKSDDYYTYDYDMMNAKIQTFFLQISDDKINTLEKVEELYNKTHLELDLIETKEVKKERKRRKRLLGSLIIILVTIFFLCAYLYFKINGYI